MSFGAQLRDKMSESSDTAGPIDLSGAYRENPKYTIRPRTTKMLQLPGPFCHMKGQKAKLQLGSLIKI